MGTALLPASRWSTSSSACGSGQISCHVSRASGSPVLGGYHRLHGKLGFYLDQPDASRERDDGVDEPVLLCTHLASGEKDGGAAELRRDPQEDEVPEPPPVLQAGTSAVAVDHLGAGDVVNGSKVVWLGDLNYCLLSTGGGGSETRGLVECNRWKALPEKVQVQCR